MSASRVRILDRRYPAAITLLILAATAAPAWAAPSPAFGPKTYVVKPGLPLPVIERFAACQPERGGQLRVENGPGGQPRVALAVVVLNQRETVLLGESSTLPRVVTRTVPLLPSNTLLVWMIGPPGSALSVSVASAGACLDVAITSPAPGTVVPEGLLLVRGTVEASQEAGVSVNGHAAMIHGRQWAVEVPVDASVPSLEAVVSVVGGDSATRAIPIAVGDGAPPPIELQAAPSDGVVPFTVTWKVVNNTGRAILQYELDRTGGGAFDPPVTIMSGAQTAYSTPGLWLPTVRALDDQGRTHTATTAVLGSDPTAVSARFDSLWSGFRSRLQAGDVTGAMAFIAPTLQPRMQQVFQDLGASLPAVAASFGALHVTDQLGDLAEAVLAQDEPTGRQLYFIQFRRDSLGRWLIEEM